MKSLWQIFMAISAKLEKNNPNILMEPQRSLSSKNNLEKEEEKEEKEEKEEEEEEEEREEEKGKSWRLHISWLQSYSNKNSVVLA